MSINRISADEARAAMDDCQRSTEEVLKTVYQRIRSMVKSGGSTITVNNRDIVSQNVDYDFIVNDLKQQGYDVELKKLNNGVSLTVSWQET